MLERLPTLTRAKFASPHLFTHYLVSQALGVLLLVAAGLKVYGLGIDPVGRAGVFSAPALQFLLMAFEVFLGLWLLWGRQPLGAWLTGLFTDLPLADGGGMGVCLPRGDDLALSFRQR